ncbi:MAG: hypothetical protein WA971_07525, partial [Microbacterium sp.]
MSEAPDSVVDTDREGIVRVIAAEDGAPRVVWSASDLKAAAECEFAWARALDAKLGRVPAVDEPEDATLA